MRPGSGIVGAHSSAWSERPAHNRLVVCSNHTGPIASLFDFQVPIAQENPISFRIASPRCLPLGCADVIDMRRPPWFDNASSIPSAGVPASGKI